MESSRPVTEYTPGCLGVPRGITVHLFVMFCISLYEISQSKAPISSTGLCLPSLMTTEMSRAVSSGP